MTPSIGTFNKRVLLTGAGWTRNWGGRLANELWEDLMGHRAIQCNPRIRKLLLEETSFETALGLIQAEPDFTPSDRIDFEKAIHESFVVMDREIARLAVDSGINIYKVQELFFKFWGPRTQGIDSGYVFTLNQDIWPERCLYNEHVSGAPRPTLPGLIGQPNQCFFTSVIGLGSNDLSMCPVADPQASTELRNNFNIIKLHGSFNWRTPDSGNQMVVGRGKLGQIASSPLLSWYFEIFKRVVSSGDVRLMIVGYGFGDEHVNAIISDAIERHNLRVFVWDYGSDIRTKILDAPHGPSIWKSVLSIASRSMKEVFPSNQAETQEYRRIVESFFG